MLVYKTTSFLSTFVFTLTKFYQFRKALKKCLLINNIAQEFYVDRIASVDLNILKNHHISALILDYDGVLCEQDGIEPRTEVINWIDRALLIFGSKRIFILSNNPLPARQDFFNKRFNNQIIFVVNKPKPYPDGIAEIYDYCQLSSSTPIEKSTLLIFDDRLSTGILAAKIFGIASCLILSPYTNIKKQFIIESWFIMLRKLERLAIWHL